MERALDREERRRPVQLLVRAVIEAQEQIVEAVDARQTEQAAGGLEQQARGDGAALAQAAAHLVLLAPDAIEDAVDAAAALHLGVLDGGLHRLGAGAGEMRDGGPARGPLELRAESPAERAGGGPDAGLGVERALAAQELDRARRHPRMVVAQQRRPETADKVEDRHLAAVVALIVETVAARALVDDIEADGAQPRDEQRLHPGGEVVAPVGCAPASRVVLPRSLGPPGSVFAAQAPPLDREAGPSDRRRSISATRSPTVSTVARSGSLSPISRPNVSSMASRRSSSRTESSPKASSRLCGWTVAASTAQTSAMERRMVSMIALSVTPVPLSPVP